ncbi:MAG TPA: hypothetical protein VJB66_04630 [Candidatus Nanoarchaeia archaeon]|nr:hypothetical protein [Candidatus Nanoarchaeia archaeon]
MEFDQSSFNQFVLDNKVIGFFEKPITLKSGRTSHFYVNWRVPTSDAYLLDITAAHVAAAAQQLGADCIYGVPEGATKLGVIASLRLARMSHLFGAGSHVIPMGRAKPKEHGHPKDRYFVGEPAGKTVVLEDVTTTGGSLIETIDKLIGANIDVIAAVTLTNRMEKRDDGLSVEQAILDRYKGKVKYVALSRADELLPMLILRDKPAEHIVAELKKEFEQYGVQPLALQ